VVVFIQSARVGMISGKEGPGKVDKLTKDLEDLCHRHIEVTTIEGSTARAGPAARGGDIARAAGRSRSTSGER